MSRFWLFTSVPAAALASWLLVKTAMSLLRTVRGSVVATVPIRADQHVTFDAAGGFTLSWESPLMARRGVSINKTLPMGLGYALTRVDPPYAVRMFFTRSQIYVNSMTRSRSQLITFELPSGGAYALHISGIDPSVDYSRFAVVIARPVGLTMVLHIIAILVLAFASIGSIVFTALLIGGKV